MNMTIARRCVPSDCRYQLLALLACWWLVSSPSATKAQERTQTRLELELGGDLTVGVGHHCHPSDDNTTECSDHMFIAGGSFSGIWRPTERLGFGVAASAGRSLFMSSEASPSLYRLAVEGRAYLERSVGRGFYAAGQFGVAWVDPTVGKTDAGPTLSIGLGHAWAAPRAGFGVALALTGTVAFFGDYAASRVAGYGTLGFIGLSMRLTYGLPL